MQQMTTSALIELAPQTLRPSWDCSRVVTLHDIKLPYPQLGPTGPAPMRAGKSAHLHHAALPAVYLQPHMGGHLAWLLVSWDLLHQSTDPAHHGEILVRTELQHHVVHWMAPARVAATWNTADKLRTLRLSLTRRDHWSHLWAAIGDPDESNGPNWLARLLLPERRCPAALRVVDPTHLQLWVKL